jgi:lysophospholipase L1-like esterase
VRRALLIALLQIPASVAFSLLVLLQGNTMADNENWTVSKAEMWRPPMGWEQYLEGHEATHRNALDLGKWHGFQEVVLVHPIPEGANRLSFGLRLDPGAYITVLFNWTKRGARGLRLSRDERFPSAMLDIEGRYRFAGREPLALSRPMGDGWHEIDLEFAGDAMHLRIDGRSEASVRAALRPGKAIGFRGSFASAVIDDVRIRRGDEVVFHDGFFAARGFWLLAIGAFTLLSMVSAAMFARARRRDPGRARDLRFALVGLHLVLAVVLWILVAGVFLFRGRSHPPAWMVGGRRNDPEAYFRNVTKPFEDWDERYGSGPPPGTYRILVIGSSQTWGSGIDRRGHDFPHRMERWLSRRLAEIDPQGEDARAPRVEVLNGGARGLRSGDLIGRLYFDGWIHLAPHLVVVNLSNNDRSRGGDFPDNLEALVVANRERGIDTMFVQEARTIESRLGHLQRNHARMKAVGDRYSVPVVPLHDYLAEHRDDGFLWWDGVHMTSFGYSLVAERLADAIWDEFLADWVAGE